MATRLIPIDFTNPRVSSMAGYCYSTVLALTNVDAQCWNFTKDVDGKLYGIVTAPDALAGTPAPAIILITGYNATTGVSRWNVANKCVANDAESYNVSLTSDTAQDITVPGTARLTKKVTFTVGDLANLAANDIVYVEVYHNGAHANDTVAVDSELYAAYLRVDV